MRQQIATTIHQQISSVVSLHLPAPRRGEQEVQLGKDTSFCYSLMLLRAMVFHIMTCFQSISINSI